VVIAEESKNHYQNTTKCLFFGYFFMKVYQVQEEADLTE
jgi:hypothetical protein